MKGYDLIFDMPSATVTMTDLITLHFLARPNKHHSCIYLIFNRYYYDCAFLMIKHHTLNPGHGICACQNYLPNHYVPTCLIST